MAVVFDAIQATQFFSPSPGTATLDHTAALGSITVGSGANRALIALICIAKATPVLTVSTATWDQGGTNQAMGFIGFTNVVSGANTLRVELWGLRAPTSGQKTLRVVLSGTTIVDSYIDEVSFTGVDQTSNAVAFADFTSNSATVSSTETITIPSRVGDINVVNWVGDATMNAPSDTQIYLDVSGGITSAAGARKAGAATSVTMTDSATNTQWAGAGVRVAASSTAGGAAIAKVNFKVDKFKKALGLGPNAGLFQVKAFPIVAPAAVVETNTSWQGFTYPSRWNLNRALLTQQDIAVDSPPAINPSWQGRTLPQKWNVNEALFLTSTSDSPAIVTADDPSSFAPRTWPAQWKLNPLLDQTTAQDTSSSAVETDTHFVFRTWPFQWNLLRALFQNPATDAPAVVITTDDPPAFIPRSLLSQWNLSRLLRGTSQDFTSPAVETNPQWIGKPWVVSWKVNPLLAHVPSTDVPPIAVSDDPPSYSSKAWPRQWNLLRAFSFGSAQDFSSSAVTTPSYFIPHSWGIRWVLNLSLLRGTAQDFSFVPPPTSPATYYMLEDQWVDNKFYLPAGTIQTTRDLGGVLPLNWVPNPNVDPVDAGAVAAYTAAGYQPRGLIRQQYTVAPVLPPNYVWQFINGAYVLVKVANFPRVPISDPQG